MRGQVVRDNNGHVRGDKGQDNPLVEGCPLSAVSDDGEEYITVWSQSLFRAGVVPGLSGWTGTETATARATRETPVVRGVTGLISIRVPITKDSDFGHRRRPTPVRRRKGLKSDAPEDDQRLMDRHQGGKFQPGPGAKESFAGKCCASGAPDGLAQGKGLSDREAPCR
jgi:hypothetical protein